MPLVNALKIAKAIGKSERWVRELAEKDLIPREAHGRYDLAKCLIALARLNASKIPEAVPGPETPSLTAERERRLRVQRERDEIRLARERGELIPVTDYRKLVGGAFRTVRDRFLNFASRIAPELEGETRMMIEKRLDAAIRDVLTSLAEGSHGNGDQPRTEPAPDPAALRPPGEANLSGAGSAPDAESQRLGE